MGKPKEENVGMVTEEGVVVPLNDIPEVEVEERSRITRGEEEEDVKSDGEPC